MCVLAARYGLRVKYHKASSISAFGAPYLQLAWAYSEHEESAADAHERRQVSLILCDVLCDNAVETDKVSCGHVHSLYADQPTTTNSKQI